MSLIVLDIVEGIVVGQLKYMTQDGDFLALLAGFNKKLLEVSSVAR